MVKSSGKENRTARKFKNNSTEKLTKSNARDFVSAIPNVDKELAMAAINQFPNYNESAKCIIEQMTETCVGVLESNDESMKMVVAAYNSILEDLGEMLKQDDLSFEERQYITEKMVEIADKLYEKDTDNKRFTLSLWKYVAGFGITVLSILAAIFGVYYAKSYNEK